MLGQAGASARRAAPKERMSPKTRPYLTLSTIVVTGHSTTMCSIVQQVYGGPHYPSGASGAVEEKPFPTLRPGFPLQSAHNHVPLRPEEHWSEKRRLHWVPVLRQGGACARGGGDTFGTARARRPAPPPCVTFRPVVVSLRGPGPSPILPFACCVRSLRSVGRCGRCSCWCRFRVCGAPSLVCWGCAECAMVCRLRVSGAQ